MIPVTNKTSIILLLYSIGPNVVSSHFHSKIEAFKKASFQKHRGRHMDGSAKPSCQKLGGIELYLVVKFNLNRITFSIKNT